MSAEQPFEEQAIWLFDSVCVLCDGAVRYTLDHERAPTIKFISIQSGTGRALAEEHGIDPDNAETFLFIENGKAMAKSDGVIALAGHVKGPFGLVRYTGFVPRFLRDTAYTFIARNRYRFFGRKSACSIPDPETRNRFILQDST